MILTVPTDANGRTSGSGARFIGMELHQPPRCSTSEHKTATLTHNPLPLIRMTTGSTTALLVTWYSEESFNFNRKGMLGCTDISDSTPVTEWTRDLQRGRGRTTMKSLHPAVLARYRRAGNTGNPRWVWTSVLGL